MDKQQAIKQALEQVRELAKKYNCIVVLKKSRFNFDNKKATFSDFIVIPNHRKNNVSSSLFIIEKTKRGFKTLKTDSEIVNVITSPIHKSQKKIT